MEALYKEPVILHCFQGHCHQREWNLINSIAISINLLDLDQVPGGVFWFVLGFCLLCFGGGGGYLAGFAF